MFAAAAENGMLDEMLAEVEAALQAVKNNEEYIALLAHPRITVDEKIAMVEAAFKPASKELRGFLAAIVRKGRFSEIEEIFSYFINRVWEEKKIGVARVTSAAALSDDQKKKIEKKLLDSTPYVEFRMNYSVDSALIGGMVVQIGDRVVDASVRTKLESMAKDLNAIRLSN